MAHGNIILLNGTAKTDKTRIIAALQNVLEKPYFNASVDKFSPIMPDLASEHRDWAESQGQTHPAPLVQCASLFSKQRIAGMHQTIAALARAGNNIIVSHMLLDAAWLRECAQLFYELPAFFIGVRSTPAILDACEPRSASRTFGQAQAQLAAVHTPGVYDLALDPAIFSPMECALQIKGRVLAGPPPLALRWLKAWSAPTKQRGWLRQNEQACLHTPADSPSQPKPVYQRT